MQRQMIQGSVFRRPFWTVLPAVLTMASVAVAIEQTGAAEPRPIVQQGFSMSMEIARLPPAPATWTVESGYLFIDYEYVSIGRQIRLQPGTLVLIDESAVMKATPEDNAFSAESPELTDNDRQVADHIYTTLQQGGVVVALTGRAPQAWSLMDGGYAVLQHLLPRSFVRSGMTSMALPTEFEEPRWQHWLKSVSAPAEFSTRAAADVATWASTTASNHASARARGRLATLNFPLTLLAMILVVLAFGHLLTFRPAVAEQPNAQALAEATAATTRCVILFAVMGVLDLVLTILAHQANAIHEVNPIGNRLLSSTPALVTFKLALTAFAGGVLYYARALRFAQMVAWWGCLTMTLLTARWVLFNHMAVS